MNMIYDIVLNYAKIDEFYEFYEWEEKDFLTYIEKIPLVKINSKQMEEILSYKIQIPHEFLEKIKNMTYSSLGILPFSVLMTDGLRVIAFNFKDDGMVSEKSSLLIDEEEAVIEESMEFSKEEISYKKLEKYSENFLLTRKEKKMQKSLLKEIERLYKNHNYAEIHYLYQEYFSKKKTFKEEYQCLVENIKNHFEEKYETLYEIIQLAEEKEKNYFVS